MKSRATALLSLRCLLMAASFAAMGARAAAGAPEEFQSLLTRMHQAYSQSDWKDYRTGARELLRFLNGSPAAMLELARADARTCDLRGAMQELQTIARMGVTQANAGTLPDFSALRSEAGFRGVLRRMSANGKPVSRAHLAFVLPDPGLLPEDLTYDPTHREFLLTSVREARIVAIVPGGWMTTFARAPDGWPMMAVRIDLQHRVVWATQVALAGFQSVPRRDWGRSSILEYTLGSHRLLRRIEGPRGSHLGDMALSSAGDLLVADSHGGGLYLVRHHDHTLMPLATHQFVFPMTPAFVSADHAYVADYVRGIGLLDLGRDRIEWLPMGNEYALQGTDGLYWYRGRLIAIQNGLAPERIMSFSLDTRGAAISRERSIQSGTPGLDPTHGVIVGNSFYYIANSGWNELKDDGSVRRGVRLTPAAVMRAPLRDL